MCWTRLYARLTSALDSGTRLASMGTLIDTRNHCIAWYVCSRQMLDVFVGWAQHLGQQHIAGLDITVDDAAAVQERQTARHVDGDAFACDMMSALRVFFNVMFRW
jgi:hypothetical protein